MKRKREIDVEDMCLPFVYDLKYAYVVVDSEEHFELLDRVINEAHLVGLDTERKPDFGKCKQHKTATLQLAIRCKNLTEYCFLVDLLLLSKRSLLDAAGKLLRALFTNPSVLKVGQGVKDDLRCLAYSFPDIFVFAEGISNILDTKDMMRCIQPSILQAVSLKNLVRNFLHCNLVKTQQLSDWSARPLTDDQLHYACCDAVVLLRLYDAMLYDAVEIRGGDIEFSIENTEYVFFEYLSNAVIESPGMFSSPCSAVRSHLLNTSSTATRKSSITASGNGMISHREDLSSIKVELKHVYFESDHSSDELDE